jgi:hypothetical protein
MPPELSNKDWNRSESAVTMVDKRCVYGPVNAEDRPCGQIRVQFGPFTNQCQSVAVFYELLYFSGMGGATEFTDANSGSRESLHDLRVGFWMSLRMIKNTNVSVEFRWPYGRLSCQRMVSAQADDQPVAAKFFHLKI